MLTLDSSALQIVRECDPVKWNALVESARTGYITQTWEWGQLSLLGIMHRVAVANSAGEYVAAILLVETRAPIMGRSYLYAPRGPVCDDPDSPALPLLLQGVEEIARKRACFMLKIEPQIEDGNAQWLRRLGELHFKVNPYATHPRRSWMIDIRVSEAELLSNMQTSSRYNINRGKRNLVVREGKGPADRAIFYALYSETAARDGFVIHPQAFYDSLMDLFEGKGAGVLHIVEYQGTPIAAHMAMRCGKVTTSMYSSSSNAHRNQRPNHPMQWAAITWAKAHGCETYDFRAIAEVLEPDTELYSLYTYKRGYGGFSYLSLVTHDLVYQPAFYWTYRQALRVKRYQDHQRHLKMLRTRQDAKKASASESSTETGN